MSAPKLPWPFDDLPVVDTERMLPRTLAKLHDYLSHWSRRYAREDLDLADDLYQCALIQLWELDPARFDDDDLPYLRRALRNVMQKAARAEQRRQAHFVREPLEDEDADDDGPWGES